jgi:hypothetical protein
MKMAKLEAAMRVVIDFNKAFNRHDVPALMALVSNDCLFENPDPCAEAAVYKGREELTLFWERFFSKYSQSGMEMEEIFGFSIHCVMRWRYDYMDASGAGSPLHGVDLFQIKNSLICQKMTYLKK